MAHIIENKKKVLTRLRRIKGQTEALERAVEEEKDCFEVLQQIASVRGAINGLMAELIEGHVNEHIAKVSDEHERAKGADELMKILRSYLK